MAEPKYAHSLAGKRFEEWHKLEKHLLDTAEKAESFGSQFAPGWGRIAGLWHDAGKYQDAFQARIGADPDAHCEAQGRVDHSTVGALIANDRKVQPLAFAIAGHHGGLPNKEDLRARLESGSRLLENARRDGLPTSLESEHLPAAPTWLTSSSLALWIRFVFSALTDADCLDTERFYQGIERDLGERMDLAALSSRLDRHIASLGSSGGPVNEMRARVLRACRYASALPQQQFTLTVPTGGGKTLASLSFALRHAIQHQLRRIIVVIPFTSILEQTAAQYRQALQSDNAVIEHHSNLDPEHESRVNRLASENWDAPIVVTTSVQFFESLYANRPSRCRKLHRIAQSVVIFDEVQTFPAKLLIPIRSVLEELTAHYGVTTVLCTATQPVLFAKAHEIVPDPPREFAAVSDRCEIVYPQAAEPCDWPVLAEELRQLPQALAIVHSRKDAQTLAELTGDDCIHLSARMCPAHRSVVLAEARQRLRDDAPCRLVSTQLVEAGVDIDFPVVFRAMAGADSLAQAAGRCNREGLRDSGRLQIFRAPTQPPRGILRTALQVTETMLKEGILDLKNPDTFRRFFDRLYSVSEGDGGVSAAEREFRFADSAKLFKMIEESGEPVVAPYGDAPNRVDRIRKEGVTRLGLRALQPYLVNLYPQEIDELRRSGALEQLDDHLWSVTKPFEHIYTGRFGFGWKGPVTAEPESLIA